MTHRSETVWMKPQAAVVVALAFALVVAGCVGSGAKKAAPTSSSSAPLDRDGNLGAIAGTITDEELVPVAAVQVALLEAQLQTASDATGRYIFSGLPPGSYRIVFSALGFKEAAKRVDVVAGETTALDVVLVPIPIVEEPYVVSVQRNILFNVDNGQIGFNLVEGVFTNISALQSLRCSPCYAVFHFAPGPKGVSSELTFDGTYVAPVGGSFVIMKYVRNWTDGSTGSSADSSVGTEVYRPIISKNAAVVWPDPPMKEVARAGDKMKVWYFVNGVSVAINLQVESWTSFSYNAPMPEAFRVLPPA